MAGIQHSFAKACCRPRIGMLNKAHGHQSKRILSVKPSIFSGRNKGGPTEKCENWASMEAGCIMCVFSEHLHLFH